MGISCFFKSSVSMILLSVASLLPLIAYGERSAPSSGESPMATNVVSSCSGQDKVKADRISIDAFNYGYVLGLGYQVDPNELNRIVQESAQLTPACQQYLELIGKRLQDMRAAGEIRDQINKLPW